MFNENRSEIEKNYQTKTDSLTLRIREMEEKHK